MFSSFFARFQTRAILVLALSAMLPATIVGAYNVHHSRKALTEAIGNGMQQEGANHATTLSLFLDAVRADLVYLRGIPSLQEIVQSQNSPDENGPNSTEGLAARDRLSEIYLSFARSRPYYQQVRYLDETGKELVRIDRRDDVPGIVPRTALQDKSDRAYFTEAMLLAPGEFYSSEIDLNRENGQIEQPYNPVIRYAVAVRDEDGRVRGTLVANLSIDYLFDLIADDQTFLDSQNQLTIVNERGSYLYDEDTSKLWGEDLGHGRNISEDWTTVQTSTLLSHVGGILKGSDRLVFHQAIYPNPATRKHPFVIVYHTPKSIIFESIEGSIHVAIAVSIVTAIAFIALGIWVFNQLVHQVQGVTDQIGTFSDRVVKTLTQHEQHTVQQSVSVREATATMDLLNNASKRSAQEAQSAALQVQHSLDRVRASLSNNSEALAAMDIVRATVSGLSQQIVSLNERAAQIGSISGLVGDLANQTNMLALNAAVEAVRAGSYGQGFSVVAAEIRKLSDASQQSGAQIHEIVSEIQRDIQETLQTTESGSRSVETGVQHVETIAEALQEVAGMMDTIAENAQAIAENSSEQAVATQQVTTAMVDLTDNASQSAERIQSLRDGTHELKNVAAGLQQSI